VRRLPAAASMPGLHAGFWIRFVAYFLDGIILSVVAWILLLLLFIPMGLYQGQSDDVWPIVVFYLIVLPMQWLYFALFESSRHQATLGKMALGIVVTDARGERIGFGRASGRYFAKIISGMIFYIGFMMAGWTSHKQALHDLMAETFVVNKKRLEAFVDAGEDQVQAPQSSGIPGWAIALIVVGVVFSMIFVIAILAAIAIPLYLNYTGQAQVSEAVSIAGKTRSDLVHYREKVGTWPSQVAIERFDRYAESHVPVGKYTRDLQVTDCRDEACSIVITMRRIHVSRAVAGKTFRLRTTDGGSSWHCEPAGDNPLDAAQLPPSCRGESGD
jgi:uncharacterized RDD family membrane protein YckC